MTKTWSYLLLVSFAFIYTPKVVFHDHDHHVEVEEDQAPLLDEECFVCDFDYSSITGPVSGEFDFGLSFMR